MYKITKTKKKPKIFFLKLNKKILWSNLELESHLNLNTENIGYYSLINGFIQ